jgi:hypothetical protein
MKDKRLKKKRSALFAFFQQILIDARDLFEPFLNLGKAADPFAPLLVSVTRGRESGARAGCRH